MGKKEKKEKKGGMTLVLMLPLFVVATVFMQATMVLILCGLMPMIIAYYADTSSERLQLSTIACCNVAGVLPYAVPLSQSGGKWEHLSYYVSDPMVWMVMYGMAGLGYVLIKICPYSYHAALKVSYASKAFQLQQKQDALVKEWGNDIAATSYSHKTSVAVMPAS
jgi:hypothetical protein